MSCIWLTTTLFDSTLLSRTPLEATSRRRIAERTDVGNAQLYMLRDDSNLCFRVGLFLDCRLGCRVGLSHRIGIQVYDAHKYHRLWLLECTRRHGLVQTISGTRIQSDACAGGDRLYIRHFCGCIDGLQS